MDYTIDTLPSRLMLGHQTETGVNDIRIDMSEWLERWPGLAISIWPTRPGESAAYPADTYMDGNCVIWRVNSADTAIAGNGTVEIMGVADGKKALSKVMTTYIPRTTTGVTTDPPAAEYPWVDRVALLAGSAQEAAQRAEDAAGEIKGMSAVAQTLEVGAEATADYADGVLTLGIPRGPQGVPGPQGDKGDTGATGPQGEQGRDGSDAEVTAGNIRAALGFEPADAATVDTKLTEPAEGLAVGKYFRVAAVDENGHAVLEAVDAKDVGVQDVQVNGASVVADGVASVPIASNAIAGVVKTDNSSGGHNTGLRNLSGMLYINQPPHYAIANRSIRVPILAENLDYAVKAAMCDGKGAAWTADEQAAARERMGIPGGYELIEEITLEETVSIIERAYEPNGTEYNFSSMAVWVYAPIAADGATYDCYITDSNNAYLPGVVSAMITSSTPKTSIFLFERHGGFIFPKTITANSNNGLILGNWTSSPTAFGMASGFIKKIELKIRREYTAPLPVGTTIKIYGVRT